MYKLRNGAFQKSGEPVKVLTVPKEVSAVFEETYFSIEKSGDSIVFTSGTKVISKKEIENYDFSECRYSEEVKDE